jgi:hypothetical protein
VGSPCGSLTSWDRLYALLGLSSWAVVSSGFSLRIEQALTVSSPVSRTGKTCRAISVGPIIRSTVRGLHACGHAAVRGTLHGAVWSKRQRFRPRPMPLFASSGFAPPGEQMLGYPWRCSETEREASPLASYGIGRPRGTLSDHSRPKRMHHECRFRRLIRPEAVARMRHDADTLLAPQFTRRSSGTATVLQPSTTWNHRNWYLAVWCWWAMLRCPRTLGMGVTGRSGDPCAVDRLRNSDDLGEALGNMQRPNQFGAQ